VGDSFGKAEASVKFYTEVFPTSSINGILLYQPNEGAAAGTVKHSQYILDGKVFMAMDGIGEHQFAFNEAISFVVECKDQQEIDHYWNKLTSDGGQESQCGWLKDKFNISWQIIPAKLGQLMSSPEKAGKVMQEIMKMKKLDLATLEKAAA
jgi:predicted 3-demethylubiquinone-9 3-methyltransferase (glyoxalase superfamily)